MNWSRARALRRMMGRLIAIAHFAHAVTVRIGQYPSRSRPQYQAFADLPDSGHSESRRGVEIYREGR